MMGSTSKRLKPSEELTEIQSGEDRISALPSSIASHILSLLPTKYAVATSVLSTRWNELWTQVTTLDFCDDLLQNPDSSSAAPSVQSNFVNFVYRVLMLCTVSCLDTFRLKCSQNYDASHVNAWLAYAVRREVKQILLSIPTENPFVLPTKLYTCRTLVGLEVGGKFTLNIPSSVCLPCLNRLYLYKVELPDDDAITRLLSGCPVLEKLIMVECIGKDVKVINIAAPLLKLLVLSVFPCKEDTTAFKFRIVLNAPLLWHLFIVDYIAQGYELHNLPELVSAHIHIRCPYDRVGLSVLPLNDIFQKALNDLLAGISTVQSLHLELEAYHFDLCNLPDFKKLTALELSTHDSSTYKQLLKLLECSPLLQTLTLTEGLGHHNDSIREVLEWKPPPKVPNCLLHHLKTIKIESFLGMEEEMILVGYFLKAAEVLEKLIIDHELENESQEICEKLLMLPRASQICQIELL